MTEDEEGDEYYTPYKVVLLGESAVGKSSLVLRFVRDEFSDSVDSTIGAAFLSKVVPIGNEESVKLDIWDTAGQERYKSLAPMYYRGAHGAIIVYDITSPDSFERAKSWIKELKRQGSSDLIISLTGNKLDLEELRKVEKSDAKAYAEEESLLFFETSAKTNTNVEEPFNTLARKIKNVKSPGLTGLCDDGKCGVCPQCRNDGDGFSLACDNGKCGVCPRCRMDNKKSTCCV